MREAPALEPRDQSQTEQLLQLLVKLENSEQFGHTAVSSIQPPSQSEPLFRYKVNVNYVQKF